MDVLTLKVARRVLPPFRCMTRQILEKSTTDFPTRWFVQEQRFPFFKLVMMESAEYYSVFAHHRFYFRRFRFRRRHFIFASFCDARNPPPKMRSHLKSSPEREARKYYAPGGFGDKEISIRAILSSTQSDKSTKPTTSSIIIELREVFEHHERRDFAWESGNGC